MGVQGKTERGIRGVLYLGAINNGCVLVGGNLMLLGVDVIPLEAEVGDVVIHGKPKGAMRIFPFEIYAIV